MTSIVREWLPTEVLTGAVVRKALDTIVAEWAGLWFIDRVIHAISLKLSGKRDVPRTQSGRRIAGNVATLQCSAGASARLLGWALDGELDVLLAGDVDRKLCDAFEERLLRDLVTRVETALGPQELPSAFDTEPESLILVIGDDRGNAMLSLAIPFPAGLSFAKKAMGAKRLTKAELVSRVQALGSTRIVLEASLGRADIAIEDLQGLAPGDVIILGKSLSDAADLSLAGSEFIAARAVVTAADGGITLTL